MKNKKKKQYNLPPNGLNKEELLLKMNSYRQQDAKWQDGKAFALVYYPGDTYAERVKAAYNMFFSENALNPTAFPSLRQFEGEVVKIMANLLGGNEETTGNMTSGGTDSILMAVHTAKEWAKINKPNITQPEIIVAESAHPAFQKAGHYLDIKVNVISVNAQFELDVMAMKRTITPSTIMLVGSAPSYPHGIMDPIEKIAQLAQQNNILCHVDACVGGCLLPFIEKLGYEIPPYNFTVEGVTSMSADLHKYGYAAKGASVVLYKNRALRKLQYFVYTGWTGGIYASPTAGGTRPGGAIAAAWAALHGIGENGYLEMARITLAATQTIKNAIENMEGLHIVGQPCMSLLAFGADDGINIFDVADELHLKGWHFDRNQNPAGIHLTVSQIHQHTAHQFVIDLQEAVAKAKKLSWTKISNSLQVGLVNQLKKVLPEGSIAKIQAKTAGSGAATSKRTAAMYGMMGALQGSGELDDIVLDFMDKLTSLE